jgi:autoinducer 2-degrading protein
MSRQEVYEWLTRVLGVSGMYVVVVFLEAVAGRQEELRDALRVHARACLDREPGCQTYDISVDPLEGTVFLLYQVYEDEAAYHAHSELPHYADFQVLTDPWTKSRRVLTYRAIALTGAA